MCGRYVSATQPDELARFFGATPPEVDLPASWNVAPTNDVYGVVGRDDGRHLEVFHWGLVPSWAKEVKVGYRMINARAETLATSGAFKVPFRKHRCLVPADGFFEWKALPAEVGLTARGKPRKQPYFIHLASGEPLALAGLWSVWRDPTAGPEAPWLHSCTIVTTDANADVAGLHDRMPVIVGRDDWDEWLDPDNHDVTALQHLLVPVAAGVLALHPVSTEVNNVRNKGPELIEPVSSPEPPTEGAQDGTLFG